VGSFDGVRTFEVGLATHSDQIDGRGIGILDEREDVVVRPDAVYRDL
jgi:hypothetical protein